MEHKPRHLAPIRAFRVGIEQPQIGDDVLLVALHSDSDGLGPTVRLARAGVSDQRGPRCCEESLAAF